MAKMRGFLKCPLKEYIRVYIRIYYIIYKRSYRRIYIQRRDEGSAQVSSHFEHLTIVLYHTLGKMSRGEMQESV